MLRDELNPYGKGRQELRKLQDIAGEVFATLGLRRGIHKEERLRFIDELKELGIEENALRRIRTALTYSKDLRDLHQTVEEDFQQKEALLNALQEIRTALENGNLPDKEQLAFVAAEISRTDPEKARVLLKTYRLVEELHRELEAMETPEQNYLTAVEQAFREGRPIPEPSAEKGRLWKRLATYIKRYNRALELQQDIKKHAQRIEKTVRKLYVELQQREKEIDEKQKELSEKEKKKRELEQEVAKLYNTLNKLTQDATSVQKLVQNAKNADRIAEEHIRSRRRTFSVDWKGLKKDFAQLIKLAAFFKSKVEQLEYRLFKEKENKEFYQSQVKHLQAEVQELWQKLRKYQQELEEYRKKWNDKDALQKRIDYLQREEQERLRKEREKQTQPAQQVSKERRKKRKDMSMGIDFTLKV